MPVQKVLFPADPPIVEGFATLSADGRYRYDLGRVAAFGSIEAVNFIMLNPSTADADRPDPTMTRCLGYTRRWGYGRLIITNLFALRSADPRMLSAVDEVDAIGPENGRYVMAHARESARVVVAWGVGGRLYGRAGKVCAMLAAWGVRPYCLAITKEGHPAHPLYQPADLTPSLYIGPGE